MAKVGVERTLYDHTITNSGNSAFVATYYCENGIAIKEWLFPKSKKFCKWWTDRSTVATPQSPEEAVNLASVGKVRPTSFVHYTQEGRWPKVAKTEVGEYPTWVAEFLNEALDVFGEIEIVKVVL